MVMQLCYNNIIQSLFESRYWSFIAEGGQSNVQSHYCLCPPQKKKKKKKNYNQTFNINNFQNCELILICFRIMKLDLIICISAKTHLNWFSSHKEHRDFCKLCHNSLPSKFWQKCNSYDSNEHWNPHSFWMVCVDLSYKTWMEGTCGIPYKNPYLFGTTEPNRMGFSLEMQIIS